MSRARRPAAAAESRSPPVKAVIPPHDRDEGVHRMLGRSLQETFGPVHPPVEDRGKASPEEVERQLGSRIGRRHLVPRPCIQRVRALPGVTGGVLLTDPPRRLRQELQVVRARSPARSASVMTSYASPHSCRASASRARWPGASSTTELTMPPPPDAALILGAGLPARQRPLPSPRAPPEPVAGRVVPSMVGSEASPGEHNQSWPWRLCVPTPPNLAPEGAQRPAGMPVGMAVRR
jgi:hypothetical protein